MLIKGALKSLIQWATKTLGQLPTRDPMGNQDTGAAPHTWSNGQPRHWGSSPHVIQWATKTLGQLPTRDPMGNQDTGAAPHTWSNGQPRHWGSSPHVIQWATKTLGQLPTRDPMGNQDTGAAPHTWSNGQPRHWGSSPHALSRVCKKKPWNLIMKQLLSNLTFFLYLSPEMSVWTWLCSGYPRRTTREGWSYQIIIPETQRTSQVHQLLWAGLTNINLLCAQSIGRHINRVFTIQGSLTHALDISQNPIESQRGSWKYPG